MVRKKPNAKTAAGRRAKKPQPAKVGYKKREIEADLKENLARAEADLRHAEEVLAAVSGNPKHEKMVAPAARLVAHRREMRDRLRRALERRQAR